MALRKIGDFHLVSVDGKPRLRGTLQLRENGRVVKVLICQNRDKKSESEPDYVAFRMVRDKKKRDIKGG